MVDPISVAEKIIEAAVYIHKTAKEIKTFKENALDLDHRTQLLQPSLKFLTDMNHQREELSSKRQHVPEIHIFSQALADMLTCLDEIKVFIDDLKSMTTRRKLIEKGEVKMKFSNFNRRLDVLERSIQFGVLCEMKKDVESGKMDKTAKTLIHHLQKSGVMSSSSLENEKLLVSASRNDNSLPILSSDDLELGEELGEGGFGTVYLAKLRRAERVAVKIFDIGSGSHVLKEASKMRQAIFSSYIVRLIGIIDEPSIQAIVMDYFEYGNLKSFLPYMDNDKWARRMRMLCDIACGLNHLHSLTPSLIHRDLKLANVFIDQSYNAKIGDLGLTTGGTAASKRLSKAVLLGTFSHIAPEAWKGTATEPKPTMDIYQFGICLFEFVSGTNPWPINGDVQVIRAWVIDGKRPSLDNVQPDTPMEIVDMMQQCWQDDPNLRPNSQGLLSFFSNLFESRYENMLSEADRAIRKKVEGGLIPSQEQSKDDDKEAKDTATDATEATQYVGLYDFKAKSATELSFDAGQTLHILNRKGSWWLAKSASGQKGYIPNNYVQLEEERHTYTRDKIADAATIKKSDPEQTCKEDYEKILRQATEAQYENVDSGTRAESKKECFDVYLPHIPRIPESGRSCILDFKDDTIRLWDVSKPKQLIVSWPLKFIRRWGSLGTALILEVGRRSEAGEGMFQLKSPHAEAICLKLQLRVQEIKSNSNALN